jgi:hypothetical protein
MVRRLTTRIVVAIGTRRRRPDPTTAFVLQVAGTERLIGHLVVASTAVGRGPPWLARARAESRLAPPGGGEVPRSGNRA